MQLIVRCTPSDQKTTTCYSEKDDEIQYSFGVSM